MHAPTRWLSAAILGACLLAPSVAFGAGTPVDQATKEQLEAAQKTFGAADVLYDAKRYEEAITAFTASYEIVASPNSRLMIARSLRELGRYAEAWKELEGAIADADAATQVDEKYSTTAKAAREDLEKLKAMVARVHVKLVGGEATVSLNGKPLDAAALAEPLVLAPGKATLTAPRRDGSEARAELDLAAGSEQNVELDLAPPKAAPPPPPAAPAPAPAPPPPSPSGDGPPYMTMAYVAGGIGAAGLITFGVFGLMNNSKFSSLEDECPGGHCSSDRQSDIDAGRRYQTIANIGLAVGVIGVGAGTALFLLGGKQSKERAALQTDVFVGPGRVMLGGKF